MLYLIMCQCEPNSSPTPSEMLVPNSLQSVYDRAVWSEDKVLSIQRIVHFWYCNSLMTVIKYTSQNSVVGKQN